MVVVQICLHAFRESIYCMKFSQPSPSAASRGCQKSSCYPPQNSVNAVSSPSVWRNACTPPGVTVEERLRTRRRAVLPPANAAGMVAARRPPEQAATSRATANQTPVRSVLHCSTRTAFAPHSSHKECRTPCSSRKRCSPVPCPPCQSSSHFRQQWTNTPAILQHNERQ